MRDYSDIIENHGRLLEHLQQATRFSLPGQEAQFKAVPPNRPKTNLEEAKQLDSTRNAAVMVLVHPVQNIPHLALIRRKEYPGVHSGQISFPGGKSELEDRDLLQTAERETSEEIGVVESAYSIWTQLTEVYIPPSKFLVQPYVALAQEELQFIKEEREVEEVLSAPLSLFMGADSMEDHTLDIGGMRYTVPVYKFEDHVIWGATAMMISELADLIRSVLPSAR